MPLCYPLYIMLQNINQTTTNKTTTNQMITKQTNTNRIIIKLMKK